MTHPPIALLDEAVFPTAPKPEFMALYGKRYEARRYVFDAHASFRVGELMRDCLDLIVDNIEFARAPYPTTYLEFSARALFRGLHPDQSPDHGSDDIAGYLIHGETVLVMAKGSYDGIQKDITTFGAISFRINRPQSVPMSSFTAINEEAAQRIKEAYVFGGQRTEESKALAGTTIEVVMPRLPERWTYRQIATHFDVRPVYPLSSFKGSARVALTDSCFLSSGDPLVATAMLLLLNQPSRFLSLGEVPRRRGIFRGKLTTFKEHHVVSVLLDEHEHVRRIFTNTDRASPRWHEVEGSWRNFNKPSDPCEHSWEPMGVERTAFGDFKRYWCGRCLQRRTWADAYTRGDPSLGIASKHYEVGS